MGEETSEHTLVRFGRPWNRRLTVHGPHSTFGSTIGDTVIVYRRGPCVWINDHQMTVKFTHADVSNPDSFFAYLAGNKEASDEFEAKLIPE